MTVEGRPPPAFFSSSLDRALDRCRGGCRSLDVNVYGVVYPSRPECALDKPVTVMPAASLPDLVKKLKRKRR
jgi:hypothetical protein